MTEPPTEPNGHPQSLLARLKDRSRWPRSWWYPRPPDRQYDPGRLPDLHEKCSETVRRAMLTHLAFSLFCLLTALGANDVLLIGAQAEIKIPFADVPISFGAFLIVAPLLLIILSIYLHIFVGHLRELEAAWRGHDDTVPPRLPALFNFDARVPRMLSGFIFYWLTPLVLAAITWKALAVPRYGIPMGAVTLAVAFATLFLHLRRSNPARHVWVRWFHWAGLAAIAVLATQLALILVLGAQSVTDEVSSMLRRPLDLFRADLRDAWLLEADFRHALLAHATLEKSNLTKANLSEANLTGANLAEANLYGALLLGADVSLANLSGADLSNVRCGRSELSTLVAYSNGSVPDALPPTRFALANLSKANLTNAVLVGADLSGANLAQTELSKANLSEAILVGANLSGASAKMRGKLAFEDIEQLVGTGRPAKTVSFARAVLIEADLSYADLTGADFSNASLRSANLSNAGLSRADFSNADLYYADLSDADLSEADLSGANLFSTDLSGTDLLAAKLSGAKFDSDIASNFSRLGMANPCTRLTVAKNWETADRDPEMACGAPLPSLPKSPLWLERTEIPTFAPE